MSTTRHPRLSVALEDGVVLLWQTKCLVVLEPAEILGLLHHDRDVWIRALRRGRSWRRAQALENRQCGNKACAHAAAGATPGNPEPPTPPRPAAGVMRHELAAPPVRLCGAPSPHEPREARGAPRAFGRDR